MERYQFSILLSYLLAFFVIIAYENPQVFNNQLLAVVGILQVLSILLSPILLWLALKALPKLKLGKRRFVFVIFAGCHLTIVLFIVVKIWPALMSV